MCGQGESSSLLLWPRQTSNSIGIKSVLYGLSRASQLCLTNTNNRIRESIWVIFPPNGLTSALQNGQTQKSALWSHLQQTLNRANPRARPQLPSSSFSRFIFSVDTQRKLGNKLRSEKGKSLKNLLSINMCFSLHSANTTQSLIWHWRDPESHKFTTAYIWIYSDLRNIKKIINFLSYSRFFHVHKSAHIQPLAAVPQKWI